MLGVMDAWRNGCVGKMDDLQAHTIPNHHPPKMEVLPKNFFSNHPCCYMDLDSEAFKYTSPNQQRQPLPSLLCVLILCMRCFDLMFKYLLTWFRIWGEIPSILKQMGDKTQPSVQYIFRLTPYLTCLN